MADEKIKIDMTKHQRAYEPGPQTRKRVVEEFEAAYPDPETRPKLKGAGAALYEEMEDLTRQARTARKQPEGD
jgi:hypothetical protein